MDCCALWLEGSTISAVMSISRVMCSAEVQTLCFVSPLCEDFDFAVIVWELDCAVE